VEDLPCIDIYQAFFLLFCVLFFVMPTFAESAKICRLKGDVTYMRKGSVKWVEATPDLRLGYGDKLKTAPESKAELIYPDGTVFRVASSTMIQMQMKSINILRGSTWVKVIKRATRFSVVTPTATAGVRGTVFDVEYEDKTKKTTVSVYNGKVAVSGTGRFRDRMVMLTKGTQSTVSNVPAKPKRFNANERSKMWASVMNKRDNQSSDRSQRASSRVNYKKVADNTSTSANSTAQRSADRQNTASAASAAGTASSSVKNKFFGSKTLDQAQNMTSAFQNIKTSSSGTAASAASTAATTTAVREKQQQEVQALKDKISSLAQSGTNITADVLRQNLNTQQNNLINNINQASYSVKITREEREKALESKQNFENFLSKTGTQLSKNLNSYGKKVVDSVFSQVDYNQVTVDQKNYLNQLLKKNKLTTNETTQAFNIIADIINKSSSASQAAAAAKTKSGTTASGLSGLDKMSLRLPKTVTSQTAINKMTTQLNQLKSIMNSGTPAVNTGTNATSVLNTVKDQLKNTNIPTNLPANLPTNLNLPNNISIPGLTNGK
jgi:NifU-like protein involved in Fe-S cluster formation